MEHAIVKALEIWALQSLLDLSVAMLVFATGIVLVEPYHRRIEAALSLRVSSEAWRVMTVVGADLLLAGVVIAGIMLVNPDVMADVKMAVPFYPFAVVAAAAALVLRLLHGGSRPGTAAARRARWLLLAASALAVTGYTFVMEGPSEEFLELHPSPFWAWVETHLRSNAVPAGLETAHWTFWVAAPALAAVLVWGAAVAIRRSGEEEAGKP